MGRFRLTAFVRQKMALGATMHISEAQLLKYLGRRDSGRRGRGVCRAYQGLLVVPGAPR